jgi:hypothetical protein
MPEADPALCWHALRVPKHGSSDDEYEDAWAADPARGRFAVADGATESSFAGLWARLLADGFVGARRTRDLGAWLIGPRRLWWQAVADLQLAWYAEMKRDQGAFATLLGLQLRLPTATRPGAWRAQAVGDSCLVRVRADGKLRAFPLTNSADFGNQPRLIGSRDGPPDRPESASGTLLPGDRFFLMTDALAQWFLRTHERGGRPWLGFADVLASQPPQDAFAALVAALRDGGALRNDDVTLVTITIASHTKEPSEVGDDQ